MKKFLLILFVVLILIIGGVAVFILTFNADKYRPMVIEKIETALDKPVELGSISLGWHGGIALELKNLVIYQDRNSKNEWLRLPAVNAMASLGPLLHKQIEVSTVVLENPQINIRPESSIPHRGAESPQVPQTPPAASVPVSQQPEAAAAALPFIVEHIKIKGGEVSYFDPASATGVPIDLRDIDLNLDHVTLDQPIKIDLKAAFLSNHQNVSVTGIFRFSVADKKGSLQDFRASVDLSEIQTGELMARVPALRNAGIKDEIEGHLYAEVASLEFGEDTLPALKANVRLENGKVSLTQLPQPIDQINMQAVAEGRKIEVQNFSALVAGGRVQARGTYHLVVPQPIAAFEITLDGLKFNDLVPPAQTPDAPRFMGVLSGSLQANSQGGPLALTGQGNFGVTESGIANMNVLREVFDKIPLLSISKTLRERLPESYQEKFEARDTYFQDFQIPVAISNGLVTINPFQIVSDTFAVKGAAQIGFDGRVAANPTLLLDPNLSEALIRSVSELQYLANQNGELQIPLIVQGGGATPMRVLPDVGYLTTRLATAKTQELLSSFMKKKEGTATSEPSSQTPSGQPEKLTAKNLLNQFLQGAVAPQDGSSQQ